MFTLYPMVGALWTSLHSWNLLSPMQWVGFDNYVKLVQDPATHRAFLNTLYYLVGVPAAASTSAASPLHWP